MSTRNILIENKLEVLAELKEYVETRIKILTDMLEDE